MHVQASAPCQYELRLQEDAASLTCKGPYTINHKPLTILGLELLQGTRASRRGAAPGQGSGQGLQEGARAPALQL